MSILLSTLALASACNATPAAAGFLADAAAHAATSAPPVCAPVPAPVLVRRRSPKVAKPTPVKRGAAPNQLPLEALTLAVGEIKLLPMAGKVSRVALGSSSLLSATTVDSNLLLIGEKTGDTSLMVWSGNQVRSYQVQIVAKQLSAIRDKVNALVSENKNIKIAIVGPDLVLSGYAHKAALNRLTQMLDQVPNVINNVSEDQGTGYTRSVLFRLHFIEVKRTLLEEIGVSWARDSSGPVFGAQGVAKNTGIYSPIGPGKEGDNLLAPVPKFISQNGSTGGVFLGLATTITSRIRLGISDGDARILASPELTAKSGGKAKLQVGGEVPIPLAGAFGATTVEFKPYGIQFSIEPNIDADDVITAKVATEVSQIDPSLTVAGFPAFLTRNTATEVSVKPGEIVALSGLINGELSNSIERVPFLGKVPIFGRLFRSDDFRNRKSELIVLLETEIISAGDGLAGKLRDRGLDAKREFEDKAGQAGRRDKPLSTLEGTPAAAATATDKDHGKGPK